MNGEPRHWGVFGTAAWGVAIAAAFVLLQSIVVAGFLAAGRKTGLSDEQVHALAQAAQSNGAVLSIATLLTAIVCVPLILGVAKLKRGSRLRDYLALRPVAWATLARWLGLTVLLIASMDALNWALGRPIVPQFMRSAYATADPAILLWIALVAGAPLFEEFFFRGFLYKGLEGAIKPVAAIVVTAAVWAVIHFQYDVFDVGTIFLIGLLLGAARWRTGSLFVPLAMHALANAVATAETALLT